MIQGLIRHDDTLLLMGFAIRPLQKPIRG